jgi:hypothetical protein
VSVVWNLSASVCLDTDSLVGYPHVLPPSHRPNRHLPLLFTSLNQNWNSSRRKSRMSKTPSLPVVHADRLSWLGTRTRPLPVRWA